MQIQEKGFHAGRDEVFDSYVLDEAAEDKVHTTRTNLFERKSINKGLFWW